MPTPKSGSHKVVKLPVKEIYSQGKFLFLDIQKKKKEEEKRGIYKEEKMLMVRPKLRFF
jgi:hypothetical protein